MTVKERDSEEYVVLVLFILSSTVYFSSTCGIFTSNAGSQYALLKALVEKQSFVINEYRMYTGMIDYASYEGNIYSDRAPGMAFAAVPFYAAGKILSLALPMPYYSSGWDPGNPAAFTSLLLSILAGGLSVVLLYKLCRVLGGSQHASIVTCLAFMYGTIFWKYSTTLFSHTFVAFLMLAAVYLAVTFKDVRKHRLHAYALFFTLGYLPLAEYPNALLTGIIILYLFLTKKVTPGRIMAHRRDYVKPIIALIIPLAAVPAYNVINFDNPLTTPYTYHQFEWVRDFSVSLAVPWSVGLVGMLFTGPAIDGGLFVVSPILLISLWGLKYLYRSHKAETLLFICLFAVHTLFYSKYRTWFGGGVEDTRYIIHVIPLLAVPLFAWVDGFLMKRRNVLEKTLYTGLMWMLLAVSVLNVADDVGTFEGHNVRRYTFPVLQPNDLKLDLATVFPNIGRLPFFFGVLCILYACATLVLKRTPGIHFKGRISLGVPATGLVVVGVLAMVFGAGEPPEGFSFTNFRYSTNGIRWVDGNPPFETNEDRLFVDGLIDVGGRGSQVVFIVSARDCLTDLYLNGRLLGSARDCTPCLHCKGVRFDLTKFVEPGLNSVSFELKGLGNFTRFEVVREEDIT
jgi:hypothetical protein